MLLLLALVAINVFISWYNAVSCGKHWTETKIMGGFPRLLMWCAATQSAIGFSMLLILAGVFGASATGHLSPKAMQATMSLWYLLIIVPAIGTGLVLTIHSWVIAWRERNWQSIGTAAWNTFATGSNLYHAANGGVLNALGDVSELFDGDDAGGTVIKLVLLLVAVALVGGVLITALLICKHDRIARREAAWGHTIAKMRGASH